MTHYLTYFESAVKTFWNNPALSNYGKEDFTFGQVAEQIERNHILLELAGAQRADKVVLCARNSAQWAMAFMSVTSYDAVVVPVLNDFPPESVQSLTAHSDATVIFTEPGIWEKMDAAAMPNLKAAFNMLSGKVLMLRDSEYTAETIKAKVEEEFKTRFPNGMKPENVSYPTGSLDELEIINYTSGTTSAPKGVMLSARNFSSNIEFGRNRIAAYEGETMLSMLPMAHLYGMAFEFVYPLSQGVHITFLGKTPTPSVLIKALSDVKPHLIVTVPLVVEKIFKAKVIPTLQKPVMKALLAIPGISNIILGKVKKKLITTFGGYLRSGLVMGGAALGETTEKYMHRMHFPYTVGYGMTECGPLIGYEHYSKFVPRSCGKPVDGMKVRIASANPETEVGEIQVHGDNVMMGYYKNPEATKATFTEDGWLRTGDLGLVDKDGNIFIKGRSKNMILSGNGQNVYPEELEDKLNALPLVSECLVVSRNNKIVALVVPDMDGFKPLAEQGRTIESVMTDYLAQVNASLPAYSHINKIELRNEPFEKTPKRSIKRFMYQ